MSSPNYKNKEQSEQHYDVFFSYSRKDVQTAMLIKSAIQALGYTVFYDQDILEGDSNWRATIAQSIGNCSGFVFFRTQNSVASKWCQREVNIADEYGKKILPVAFRHAQNSLPESTDIKLALSELQTSYISDSPSISDLKNELQAALENSIGAPLCKENSLLLTDFIVAAVENINTRYSALFEYTGAKKITTDINNYQISLRWRLNMGDEIADLGIALNSYAKRPQCYSNCDKIKVGAGCPFYAAKDTREYSIEAYLEFYDKSRKSRIYDVLETLLEDAFLNSVGNGWCGNQRGIKYFFRKAVLTDCEVNSANDFKAALQLLEEAVQFYDTIFCRLEKYVKYSYDVCEIFRNEQLISNYLNSDGDAWTYNTELQSNEKIHFYKTENLSGRHRREDRLGILSSVAVKYPEALRVRLLAFEENRIKVEIIRFNEDKQASLKCDFLRDDSETSETRKEKIAGGIQHVISSILAKEPDGKVSTMPSHIHDSLNHFVTRTTSLYWHVSQDELSAISATGFFRSRKNDTDKMQEFSAVRFSVQVKNHKKNLDLATHITSDFLGADEQRLSEITGFPIIEKTVSEEEFSDFLADIRSKLDEIHSNIYQIYKQLKELDNILGHWKKNKAGTVLLLDSSRCSYVDAYTDNEKCWEYYLSPGTRLCRRLRSAEYPVMFNIHFKSSGAQDATIGWYADSSFKKLTHLEKIMFWRYVLSQFPPEWQYRFACRENEIVLADTDGRNMQKDFGERKVKIFHTTIDVERELESWLSPRPEGCFMDQMFSTIDKIVQKFNI